MSRTAVNFSTSAILQTNLSSRKCPGCGAVFQKTHPNHAGYLPVIKSKPQLSESELEAITNSDEPLTADQAKLIMQRNQKTQIICKKCHSHKSGAERTQSLKTNILQFSKLKVNKGGLVFLILDLLDLQGTFVNNLVEYVGQKDFVILLNKCDVMPDDYDFKAAIKLVKSQPFAHGCLDVIPISARSGEGVPKVLEYLGKTFAKNEDCYMVGCTSVGKSTLFNHLKKLCGDEEFATTSVTSGTTSDLIGMACDTLMPAIETYKSESAIVNLEGARGGNYLYDTAGIVHKEQLYNLFVEKELSYISPQKQLRLQKIHRRGGQSLFLGGFIRLDFHKPSDCEVWLYSSKKLPTHEARTARVEALMEKIGSITGNAKLYPPLNTRKTPFPPLLPVPGTFKSEVDHSKTYFISGAGWFTIKGPASFTIYSPDGLGVYSNNGSFVKITTEGSEPLPAPELLFENDS